jgi:hypothetical protein
MRVARMRVPLWTVVVVVVATVAVTAIGPAVGGGDSNRATVAKGIPPGGTFVRFGNHYYGVKSASLPAGTSQRHLKLKCPRRTHIIGGGGGGSSKLAGEQMINYEGPFDSSDANGIPEDGWTLYEDNFDLEGNERIITIAICVKNT